jgi:hypothetical protein
MSRKNSKSGQKRGRVTRDLPVRNEKNSQDAKGAGAGSMQVVLCDGSVRTLSSGGVIVGLTDASVKTIGSF